MAFNQLFIYDAVQSIVLSTKPNLADNIHADISAINSSLPYLFEPKEPVKSLPNRLLCPVAWLVHETTFYSIYH